MMRSIPPTNSVGVRPFIHSFVRSFVPHLQSVLPCNHTIISATPSDWVPSPALLFSSSSCDAMRAMQFERCALIAFAFALIEDHFNYACTWFTLGLAATAMAVVRLRMPTAASRVTGAAMRHA